MNRLEIVPIEFAPACEFIRQHHRHHLPPVRAKFQIACALAGEIVGVAIVGRPVARMLCDGLTLEVTRCCTDGTPHAASKLYAACWRAARAMGYRRLITYTLAEEPGVSLHAAGYKLVGMAGGGTWSRPNRFRVDKAPTGQKQLWAAA